MKVRLDVMASNAAPGFEDDDFTLFFVKAEKVFAKQLISSLANPAHKGIEQSEKRSKDLTQLKDHDVVTVFTAGDHGINSYICNLPDNFWLTLKEELSLTYTDNCGNEKSDRIPVKPVIEDYYNANIKSTYKKPYEEKVWRLDRERGDISQPISSTNKERHELILFDGATPTTYHVSYYRDPKGIDLTDVNDFCEFDPMSHEKIADIGVELMMQTVGRTEDTQIKAIENMKIVE